MLRRSIFLMFVLCILVSKASALDVPPGYHLLDLGSLPSYPNSWGNVVDDSGQVYGNVSSDKGSSAVAFATDARAVNVDLGGLGGTDSEVHDANESGMLVGESTLVTGEHRATRFDPLGTGSNFDLGTLPGGTQSRAHAVSSDNVIVGRSNLILNSTDYGDRATVFDSTGEGANLNLGVLPSFDESRAYDINESGLIVGFSIDRDRTRATLFDGSGRGINTDLGRLTDGESSQAWSVNNNDQIVGVAEASGGWHATLFDASGSRNNVDLGTLSGYSTSFAWDINDFGMIVGESRLDEHDFDSRRATVFDISGTGRNVDLNSLIDPSLNWTLSSAVSINNRGQITGWGLNALGQSHAYLLTPIPEPTGLNALILGSAVIFWRRSKTQWIGVSCRRN